MSINVNEIFYSIQGESLATGRPCIFIRLSGCNLRCAYCDTTYAYTQGSRMTVSEILAQISQYNCLLVEITGGEPLQQNETPRLITRLIQTGYEVLLETNGTFDIGKIHDQCVKIVDIKCPSSGESDKTDLNNLSRIGRRDQIKFVIANRNDYEYSKNILKRLPNLFPMHQVLFSPVFSELKPDLLASWILADNLDVRFHLQLHKFIWSHTMRGV